MIIFVRLQACLCLSTSKSVAVINLLYLYCYCRLMAKKQRAVKQEKLTDVCPVRKKRERFDGLTEDEVLAKTLPDHLAYDLDIIIVCFVCYYLCI